MIPVVTGALSSPSPSPRRALLRGLLGICLWIVGCSAGLILGCGGNIGNNKFYEGKGGVRGVTIAPDGSAAPYVSVFVLNHPEIFTTSGEDGQFILKEIPAGRREILMFNGKGLGAKITVWVVGGRLTEVSPTQGTLLSTATLSGRVVAAPRLTYRGIKLSLPGTPYTATTSNDEGDFRLPQLAAGCYTIAVEASHFQRHQIDTLCVKPGTHRVLDHPIVLQPSAPCNATADCGTQTLCHKGYCVPQGPGQVQALTQRIAFRGVKLQESATQTVALLKNTGYGPLAVSNVHLDGDDPAFTLHPSSPSFPRTLAIGETLSVTMTFRADVVKEHRAALVVQTDDPNTPTLHITVQGEIDTRTSDCLTFHTGNLPGNESDSREIPISVSVYNRCGEPIAVNPPASSQQPPAHAPLSNARCDTQTWGHFAIPTCITASQAGAIPIGPGESRTLKWTLTAFGYGPLEGNLKLTYTERQSGQEIPRQILLPIHTYLKAPGLEVVPRTLDFGAVAPHYKQVLWLGLRFAKALPTDALLPLHSVFLGDTRRAFQIPSPHQARTLPQSTHHYVPIEYTAPTSPSTASRMLVLTHLPQLQGIPYYIPLQAQPATPSTPILSTKVHLGATNYCRPPTQTITLRNPGDRPVTIQHIGLRAAHPGDFLLHHGVVPFTLPAQSTVPIGTLQWNPPTGRKSTRSLGLLEVRARQNQTITTLTTQLRGQAGFPHTDTFHQPEHERVNLLVFTDPRSESHPDFTRGMVTLLEKMLREQIDFTIHNITTLGSGELPITSSTANPEGELRRLLQVHQSDGSAQGLKALASARQRLQLPNAQSTTVALFVGESDDRSPYPANTYLPEQASPVQSQPLSFYAMTATPLQSCQGQKATQRYPQLALHSGTLPLDLCLNVTSSWNAWFSRLESLLRRQRKRFPLRYQPDTNSLLTVKINGNPLNSDLPNRQWKYNPITNEIVLLEAQLAPGDRLSVTYHTACP